MMKPSNPRGLPVLLVTLAACLLAGCLGPKTLGEALARRASLTSLQMTLRTTSGKVHTMFVQLDQGVPAKIKTVAGERWMLQDQKEMVVYVGVKGKPAVMKLAAKDPRASGQGAGKAPDVDAYDKQAKVVGSETVDGVSCVKIVAKDTTDGGEATLWVGRKYGLLRRLQKGGETLNVSYDQINAVAPGEFEIPKDAKIMDLSNVQRKLGDLFKGLRGGGGGGANP